MVTSVVADTLSFITTVTAVCGAMLMAPGLAEELKNSEIVELMFANYSVMIPPLFNEGGKINVECNIHVNSIDSISESTMDYQVSMFLRQKWDDPRLAFSDHVASLAPEVYTTGGSADVTSSENDTMTSKDWILLEPPLSDLIWIPDLIFTNEKDSYYHVITTPNKYIRIFANGTAFYSSRISVTLSCAMVLHKFPIDTQKCFMKLTSYTYTKEHMQFSWRTEKPVEVSNDLQLPQFQLEGTSTQECHLTYSTGEYSCLEAQFTLRRDVAFFIILSYIPSALLVVLSWVNFWLSMDAVPARITLGVLSLLTITTQSVGSNEDMPPVNYIKAIDVWNVTCMTFIFAALLEFAVVNVLSRKSVTRIIYENVAEIQTISRTITAISLSTVKRRNTGARDNHFDDIYTATTPRIDGGLPPPDQHHNTTTTTTTTHAPDRRPSSPDTRDQNNRNATTTPTSSTTSSNSTSTSDVSSPLPSVKSMYTPDPAGRHRARRVDEVSRIAFPVAFVAFNVLYWLVYKYSLWGLVHFY